LSTGKFIRPADHDDDFFYAYLFARSAIDICPKIIIGASSMVGGKYQNLKHTLSKSNGKR